MSAKVNYISVESNIYNLLDVNECLTGAHDCISGCHNVIGEEGYFCLCGGNNSGPSCPGQCKWGNEMLSNTENRTVGCDIIVCKVSQFWERHITII